ncbi:unnamed protein product [Urochloa decumbens]|uniref:Uncharacterized protein n=1 Tax=Urochloa decumbens TaxID=240449 RepID=A0ABC8ZVF3_9POAL
MDLSPEPSILIHMDSSRETDFGTCLWTVFEFFNNLGVEKHKTLVVIILPDAKYCHVNVECVCGNLGLVYQLCLPRHTRRASEEYLKNAANKIKAKILPCNSLSGPCEDMCEDDDPEELCYFDEEMGDGSESDDSDVETSDNSRHESGRHDFPEKLPCSVES